MLDSNIHTKLIETFVLKILPKIFFILDLRYFITWIILNF